MLFSWKGLLTVKFGLMQLYTVLAKVCRSWKLLLCLILRILDRKSCRINCLSLTNFRDILFPDDGYLEVSSCNLVEDNAVLYTGSCGVGCR